MRTTGCLLAMLLGALLASRSAAAPPSAEQLTKWLKQYPAADTNKDGALSVEEAEAYQKKLAATAGGARHEFPYATMSDGVKIALSVAYPRDLNAEDTKRKWAAIFMTCGYSGCAVPMDPAQFGDRYVTVTASIRGTGASGGAISPWRARTWQDGREVIDGWIAKQPWSNGKVGMIGRSWPGLMGFLTATTAPESLKAVVVSGLIDDYYRGIAYPGGIRNYGFPIGWAGLYYLPHGAFGSDGAARQVRNLTEAQMAAIQAGRPDRDLTDDFMWTLLHDRLDSPKWQQQTLSAHAPNVRAAILMGHSWQDEQTGPTGWQSWKKVPDNVPKRLILSNGSHGSNELSDDDARRWFDHWLLDKPDAEIEDPTHRVKIYFESTGERPAGQAVFGTPMFAPDFPLPETRWTRYHLREGGRLATDAPPAEGKPSEYFAFGAGDQADRLTYEVEFPETTALCGPAVVTLWATLTTLDTDFYALLTDVGPDGVHYGLQRGLLRASHRALDPERCEYAEVDGQRMLIRPYHRHTELEPVTPFEVVEYQIEIPAFGHVLRPGHKLVLTLTRAPAGDQVGPSIYPSPYYRYESNPPPSNVKILQDAEHPSSVLLPVLAELPTIKAEAVPLSTQAGIQPVRPEWWAKAQ